MIGFADTRIRSIALASAASLCGCGDGVSVQDGYTIEFDPVLWLSTYGRMAFSIDLKQPLRAIDPGAGKDPGLRWGAPDFSTCDPASQSLFEKSISALQPGDPAWVGRVDLDFTSKGGSICYGYHQPGGAWTWDFTLIPPAPSDDPDHHPATFSVNHEPVDAIAVVVGGDWRPAGLAGITFEAKPAKAAPP